MSNVVENANTLNTVWSTFGKREMNKWGLSGDVEFAPMESVGRLIKIKNLDVDFPRVIKRPGYTDFDYYRYYTPYGAFYNILREVTNFANVPFDDVYTRDPKLREKFGQEIDGDGDVAFSDYYLTNDVDLWNRTSVNENGDRVTSPYFVIVNGGSYAISKKSAISYPINSNWTIDPDWGYHLSEIENDDWWEELSAEDRAKLEQHFG
jgi:hypothetical protein